MQRWHVLLVAGLIGVAALLLVPFEALISKPLPPIALRGLATLQPAILTAIAVLLGEITARRVGLRAPLVDAWIAGNGAGKVFRHQWAPALVVSITAAAVLLIYNATIGRDLLAGAGPHARLASFDLPLIPKLLYGGVTEEILTRWALVSLFVWLGWYLSGRPTKMSTPVLAGAVILAALLFAAGHLPFLYLVSPRASAGTVAAVLVGNAIPGTLFGWLFVRRGLEAAVLAHIGSHLLSAIAIAVV